MFGERMSGEGVPRLFLDDYVIMLSSLSQAQSATHFFVVRAIPGIFLG